MMNIKICSVFIPGDEIWISYSIRRHFFCYIFQDVILLKENISFKANFFYYIFLRYYYSIVDFHLL